MRPRLKRIQPMPNVPLAYVSVYRRMSDIFHTLAYASTIRNSVTGPLNLKCNVKQLPCSCWLARSIAPVVASCVNSSSAARPEVAADDHVI
jgi:hypothetical protein